MYHCAPAFTLTMPPKLGCAIAMLSYIHHKIAVNVYTCVETTYTRLGTIALMTIPWYVAPTQRGTAARQVDTSRYEWVDCRVPTRMPSTRWSPQRN